MVRRTPLAALGLAALGLIVAIIAAPVAATAKDDALQRVTKAGTIRVAVPDNFPPFGTLGPDAKLQGYDIDTAALMVDALGVKLDLVPVASVDRIPYLTAGKVDLVISSLGKNAEREKAIDFSIAYAPFFGGVFGAEDLAVAKPEDLAGKTIAVTRNTIEDVALTQVAPPTAAMERFDDNAGTEVAFLASRTELIATGNVVAAAILAENPPKKPKIKFLLRNSPCYVGVNKGEANLLARVDAILAAALKDGGLNRISEHWLNAPLGDPEHPSGVGVK
jgi:polar amino acid transport system substrate-binding protein